MKKPGIGTGALVGGLLTAPLIGLMYLGDQLLELSFPPFDLFNWIARILPGPVITFGIDLMIDTLRLLGIDVADASKTAEQIMAIILFLVIGIIAGAICFTILKRRDIRPTILDGFVIGALFGLPMLAISIGVADLEPNPFIRIAWLALLYLGWGLALRWTYNRTLVEEQAQPDVEGEAEAAEALRVEKLNRRQFLIFLGGSAALVTVVSTGLGALLAGGDGTDGEASTDDATAHEGDGPEGQPFPNVNDPVMPAPGTRPEYTPLKDHYKVFIELEPTVIDGNTWRLPITGMVDNPLMLSIEDLRKNYTARDQYVTLSCISGRIPTSLISTTFWTGVSLQEVLADAQVSENARYLYITSGDGFYETVDLELINSDERIMLCYAWDGKPLPVDHGYPLRIWIPDRFGMKQPKWITAIEVTDEYKEGYWVERGWDEVAQVKTRSVIDTVAENAIIDSSEGPLVPIGGIAFSGDRGISKVEISVDGGPWEEALLRSPLSETTWVIWRYDWPFEAGEHTFEVRCYERDGTLQIMETNSPRPSGATGIHSLSESL